MELEKFIELFTDELDDTPATELTGETEFKELPEWSSLAALSIISMVDDEYDKNLTPSEIRESKTIEDLWKLIENK